MHDRETIDFFRVLFFLKKTFDAVDKIPNILGVDC